MIRVLLFLAVSLSTLHAVDFSPLEKIPIQENGRKKPYLVFADESLLGLTGRTTFTVGQDTKSALEIITTLWLAPTGWDQKPLLLVSNKPLKEAIGLDPARKYFSYQELTDNTGLRKLLSEASLLRARPTNERLSGLPKAASEIGLRLGEFEALTNGSAFRFIASPAGADAPWIAVPGDAAVVAPLSEAFQKNDNAAFAKAADSLRQNWAAIEPQYQPPTWKIDLETLYQKTHPFRWAWIFYAAAGLVLIFFFRSRNGYPVAWVFALAGVFCQVAGFTARVLIGGRGPVTNMYESVIWVAFGIIVFALLFEAIYRSRYFLLGAAPIAVFSLILADTQVVALDHSIHPLTAVLRDNFWLSTHVTTITLGYAAFALALGLGHIVLGQVILRRKPSSAVYLYLYRALQVGVLLLATGTILGGVWANYSWGRFWDFDPKETWALITLLTYLFILHGRIAGRWGGFGLAVGAVLAFQCVLMAWYGVNFVLGVGLHSYGFGTGGFGWAIGFVIVELAFVTLAVIRHRSGQQSSSSPTEGVSLASESSVARRFSAASLRTQ